jgi:hypothetical protein
LLPPLDAQHAIQEQNLKAALETTSIFVETVDMDGIQAVEEVEREVRDAFHDAHSHSQG